MFFFFTLHVSMFLTSIMKMPINLISSFTEKKGKLKNKYHYSFPYEVDNSSFQLKNTVNCIFVALESLQKTSFCAKRGSTVQTGPAWAVRPWKPFLCNVQTLSQHVCSQLIFTTWKGSRVIQKKHSWVSNSFVKFYFTRSK